MKDGRTVVVLPRQTVDRACHPTLGEGVAVYDNGPAFFRADSGEVVPMRHLGFGGAGRDGTYLRAITTDGAEVRLDTTKRSRGAAHERATGKTHGAGWLVRDARKHSDATFSWAMYYRFEPDTGQPFEMWAQAMWVGLPADDTDKIRSEKRLDEIYERRRNSPWLTIKTIDGDFFVYRRGDGPLPEKSAPTDAPEPADPAPHRAQAKRA